MPNSYHYYINLNERGEFNADIRDSNEVTIWEIIDIDSLTELVEDGFISHYNDINSIKSYLVSLSILPAGSNLIKGN